MKAVRIPVIEACAIGAIAGFSAVLLNVGVKSLSDLRSSLSELVPVYILLPVLGLVGGYVSGLMVERIAPEASGSGIPQVKAALSRIKLALDLRVALVKLLGGTIALGSGLFLGREGPTVQVGAALAAHLSRWLKTPLEFRRQLIAAGAAAGLAAAFDAPIAGVVFVLEELLKEVRPSTIAITVISCVTASVVLHFFGVPYLHVALNGTTAPVPFGLQDIPFYILLGIFAGLVGALFNRGIFVFLDFNRQILRIPTSLKVALAGAVSGAVIAGLPRQFHDFSRLKELVISGALPPPAIPTAFVAFLLLTLIAYGSGAPGGLFAPALALGSVLGNMVGFCDQHIFSTPCAQAFALTGMGALFSAVSRAPLTSIVIVFEMTANFGLVMPLMIACVIASTIADRLYKGSLYDLLMVWNGIHLRGPTAQSEQLAQLTAGDVMRRQLETLGTEATLKEALESFAHSNQRGFPVVDKDRLVGVITQTDLQVFAENRISPDLPVTEVMTPHPVSVNPQDPLEDILILFARYQFTWLPVTREDRLEGIILRSDIVQSLLSEQSVGDLTEMPEEQDDK